MKETDTRSSWNGRTTRGSGGCLRVFSAGLSHQGDAGSWVGGKEEAKLSARLVIVSVGHSGAPRGTVSSVLFQLRAGRCQV